MRYRTEHSWYKQTGTDSFVGVLCLEKVRSLKLGTVVSFAPASLENMQA